MLQVTASRFVGFRCIGNTITQKHTFTYQRLFIVCVTSSLCSSLHQLAHLEWPGPQIKVGIQPTSISAKYQTLILLTLQMALI